jgi:hypothetical protein
MKKQDSNSLKQLFCSYLVRVKAHVLSNNVCHDEKMFNDFINPKLWSRVAKKKLKTLDMEDGVDFESLKTLEYYFRVTETQPTDKSLVRVYQHKVDEIGYSVQDLYVVTDETDTKVICIAVNID